MVQYLSPGVYLEELEAGSRPIEGVGTAVAAFVGLAEKGPFNRPTLIANWTQFTGAFGSFIEDAFLAHAVYGYFSNGGGACYIVRVGADATPSVPKAELPSATDASFASYLVSAREPLGTGDIVVEVSDPTEGAPEETFTLAVERGSEAPELLANLLVRAGTGNVVARVNAESRLVTVEETGRTSVARRRPANGRYPLTGGATTAMAQLDAEEYIGDVAQRRGLGSLQAIDEITMVCVPDAMATYNQGHIDLDGVQQIQQAIIDACGEMKDRMAILDAPRGFSPQQVKEWRVEKARYDSPFAALYWPWIKVLDPLSGQPILVPPSGHLAGIWSRTDQSRGVHKAPANESVSGALDLETQITRVEHDMLNPEGINVIRSFPGRGTRVWGARTLSSDATWKYVNVRRLFNYIEESILEGTDWVVFEPNDLDLWQRIRRTVGAFLLGMWRNGQLFGASPEEAFYVKCDAETNPDDVIGRGEVVIEVGVAPVKPAEFVIFRVRQLTSGGQLTE
jgi:phage tail sheath protein FI